MNIGALIYDRIDQIDFTGPFEALSRLPGATVRAQPTGLIEDQRVLTCLRWARLSLHLVSRDNDGIVVLETYHARFGPAVLNRYPGSAS